jgi:hypothetical protein
LVSGDDVAGDGRYALKINLPVGTPTGNYTFVFQAIDKSDSTSNEISHILTVVQ